MEAQAFTLAKVDKYIAGQPMLGQDQKLFAADDFACNFASS